MPTDIEVAQSARMRPIANVAADLLECPFLVVHEIVEIEEAKRRGLRIAKDVIVRNVEAIHDAHLVAAEVELGIAVAESDLAYVRSRYADLESGCDDPALTAAQRAAYDAFRDRLAKRLRDAERGRETEEL